MSLRPNSRYLPKCLVNKENTNETVQKWCALIERVGRYIAKEMQPFTAVKKRFDVCMLLKGVCLHFYIIMPYYHCIKNIILKENVDDNILYWPLFLGQDFVQQNLS